VTGLLIRPAVAADVGSVLGIWRAAESVVSATDDPEHVGALIARGDDQLLVAELDGRLVGTLIAAFDGWRANLYRMAVAPHAQRRGVARALVAEAERRLRGKGAVRIHAGVRGDHEHATGFWEAVGYGHLAEMRRYTKTMSS
jgi:ribosomal protein S18 acetylase RimI-like enzyme